MKITLQYSVNADDYHEFMMAFMKHQKSLIPRNQRGVGWVIRGVFVAIFLGFCIVLSVLPSNAPPPAAPAPPPLTLREFALSLLPYLLVFVIVMTFFFWMRRSKYLYRRLAAQATRIDDPRIAEIDDAHITIREHGCVIAMEWSYPLRFIETRNLFLLFTLPRVAHILPKRHFSPADVDAFRSFAQAHVGNVPIGFPVQQVQPPPIQNPPV